MAEATTEITVTPQELGRQLRSVRRKKGLSLSEVARGAGLSRRELVAYERGKLPIPESDLWVLAGSCGVDVAELMPSTTSKELVPATGPRPASATPSPSCASTRRMRGSPRTWARCTSCRRFPGQAHPGQGARARGHRRRARRHAREHRSEAAGGPPRRTGRSAAPAGDDHRASGRARQSEGAGRPPKPADVHPGGRASTTSGTIVAPSSPSRFRRSRRRRSRSSMRHSIRHSIRRAGTTSTCSRSWPDFPSPCRSAIRRRRCRTSSPNRRARSPTTFALAPWSGFRSARRPRAPSSWSTQRLVRRPQRPSAWRPTLRRSTSPCARARTAGTRARRPACMPSRPTTVVLGYDRLAATDSARRRSRCATRVLGRHRRLDAGRDGCIGPRRAVRRGSGRATDGRRAGRRGGRDEPEPTEVLASETFVEPGTDSPFVADWEPDPSASPADRTTPT